METIDSFNGFHFPSSSPIKTLLSLYLCHLVAKFATNAIMVPSGGQICNKCKWRRLMAKFATYFSGAIWWPNL